MIHVDSNKEPWPKKKLTIGKDVFLPVPFKVENLVLQSLDIFGLSES